MTCRFVLESPGVGGSFAEFTMKSARRSIAAVVTILVMLAAYVVSTTAAAAHIHVHQHGSDGHVELRTGTPADAVHDDGCALCDQGPLLALPTVAALPAEPSLPHVEHATELRTAPPCAERPVTTLRGPPVR